MPATARAQETVARIRRAGARLFAQKGYGETTTRELAAAVEVTIGTFYYYFPSKEELLRQICEAALEEITATVTAELVSADDGRDAIGRLIRAHVRTIVAWPDAHITMLSELRSLTGEHRATVVAARDAYEDIVRDVLAKARGDGTLNTPIELELLKLLLLNLMNWTIFWYRPETEPGPDAIAGRMEMLFLSGAAG